MVYQAGPVITHLYLNHIQVVAMCQDMQDCTSDSSESGSWVECLARYGIHAV